MLLDNSKLLRLDAGIEHMSGIEAMPPAGIESILPDSLLLAITSKP